MPYNVDSAYAAQAALKKKSPAYMKSSGFKMKGSPHKQVEEKKKTPETTTVDPYKVPEKLITGVHPEARSLKERKLKPGTQPYSTDIGFTKEEADRIISNFTNVNAILTKQGKDPLTYDEYAKRTGNPTAKQLESMNLPKVSSYRSEF